MCGIFGVWNLNGKPIDARDVQRATTRLQHRGPDDEGYLLVDTRSAQFRHCGGKDTIAALDLQRIENETEGAYDLALGFRRLSILDLSPAGHQPMASGDGRLWIIFNGEIYNYVELRAELAGYGHEFHTSSDTEVILAAYQQWGRDCLSRFNGMWAIALWDAQRRELFCARDRLGVKPFYYSFDGEQFVFASEIKAILEMVSAARQVNDSYLSHFLMSGIFDHGEQTFFAGVSSLRAAHYMIVRPENKTLKPQRYWDINPPAIRDAYDYAKPENTFKELLTDSVRLRLRSDVPVGTCLSGGIDSSAIVALATSMLPHSMNSFSSVYAHAGFSEEYFIQLVAKNCSTQSHLTSPDPQHFFELLPKIIYHLDEPAAGPGVYSQWFVMELAGDTVTVLLDGQGGDELFAGYFPYLPIHVSALARKAMRELNRALFARLLTDAFALLRNGRRHFFPQLTAQQFMQKVLSRISGKRLRADFFLNQDLAREYLKQPVDEHNPLANDDPLNRKLYWDVTRDSIPALLHYEDRNSMAFGIEARVPLLDYRIVEFALGLPGELKIKGSTTKHFMRQALKDILPEAVRNRTDKMGYPTPLAVWLRGPLKEQTQDFLREHVHRRSLYNRQAIERIWQEHQTGAADHSWQIFRWIATEMWMQNFIDA